MTKKESLQSFEEKKIRSVWDDKEEKWYFSVVDVIEALTDSADPKQYLKKMKSRDPELGNNWGTICTLVQMNGADGKKRQCMAADMKGIFRLIQSIPSPKAEPFKQWMAQVASARVEQMQDPELTIDQAIVDYKLVGNYSPDWAIAFQEGTVKHVYFVAETKGSMSSMDLRDMEKGKIACAEKLFEQLSTANIKYGKVDSFDTLMDLVK